MKKSLKYTILLVLMVIAGCSKNYQIAPKISQTKERTNQLFETSLLPAKPKEFNQVIVTDDVYLGGKVVDFTNETPLPQKLEQENGVTIYRKDPLTLREITTIITKHTGIPVLLNGTTANNSKVEPSIADSIAAGPIPAGRTKFDDSQNDLNSEVISISDSLPEADEMIIQFSGKLSALLDMIAAHYNVVWKYNSKNITIDFIVSKSFDVPALPVIANMSFNVGTGLVSGDENSSVSSVQSATTNSVTNIWQDIQNGLSAIIKVNNNTNNFTVSMSTGVITVSADPSTIKRAASYIKHLNNRLQDQVAISVKVYSVGLRDSDIYEFDILGIFEDSGRFGIGFGQLNNENKSSTATEGASGIGWALLDNDSAFNGSSALIQALSERGEVAVVTSASVTTLNGVPVPLQVGQERDYVSEIEVTTQDETVTTEITTDTVSAGFNLHLIPLIGRSGNLTLQFGMNISELAGAENGFDTFSANGHTVQLRRINQRNFVQQVKIPHRKTLVLAGFEQVRSTIRNQGTGSPYVQVLGGGRRSSEEREVIVIAITPTILNFGVK